MKKEPLYKIIYNDLKSHILNGILPFNSQLPTEKELSDQYKVSRITSKRALNDLAEEGYIIRISGKGSFVILEQQVLEKTFNLTLLLPSFKNARLEEYIRGITDYLKSTPFHLTIHSMEGDFKKQRRLIYSLSQSVSDGLLLYPDFPNFMVDLVYTLYLNKFPIVLLDKELADLPIPIVSSANFKGGYEAALHAIQQGHQNILFYSLASLFENSSVKNRYLGYLKALHEHNIEPNLSLYPNDQTLTMNQSQLFRSFLEKAKEQGYTCIFVEHDILAMELISVATSMEWDLPTDMSFIGFDDLALSRIITPKLTTIKQNFYQIGYTAAQWLVNIIANPDEHRNYSHIEIPTELIVRESVYDKKTNFL